jgi:hypothetical protein
MKLAWVRISCAFAIILAAFAHQPVIADENSAAASLSQYKTSEYTLPDGTVLSLCLYTPADGDPRANPPCEFCRIADGANIAPPCAQCSVVRQAADAKARKPVASSLPHQIFQPATPLRGPPKSV